MIFRIAARIAARYWDPNDRSSSDTGDVKTIVNTDYDIASSIGESLKDLIYRGPGALFPNNYFSVKDTQKGTVKGFGKGYFSFGLEPIEWVKPENPSAKILAAGSTLLMRGSYGVGDVARSDKSQKWIRDLANKSYESMVSVGYYNKLKGGDIKNVVDVGKILIKFDGSSHASVKIADPGEFKKNVEKFVENIYANPPPEAIAKEVPKKIVKPPVKPRTMVSPAESYEFGSVDKFVEYIHEWGAEDRGQYNAGGRAKPGQIFGMSDLTFLVKNTGRDRKEIKEELESRGLKFDPAHRLDIPQEFRFTSVTPNHVRRNAMIRRIAMAFITRPSQSWRRSSRPSPSWL